ncbi:hypothetical protein KFU94_57970 [Chloroflexi bacterium TSY]|nr:hypothetical protein [Chloroflexi bacterium TSY]
MRLNYSLPYLLILSALWIGVIYTADPAIASSSKSPLRQESDSANLTDVDATESGSLASIDLSMTHELILDSDGDGDASPGDTIRYSIALSNTAPITMAALTLIFDYDEALVRPIHQIGDNDAVGDSEVLWSIELIPPGGNVTQQVDVLLSGAFPPGTTQVTTAAAMELIRDLDGNGAAGPGDTLRYLVEVKNQGNAAAQNVIVTSHFDETHIESVANIDGAGESDDNLVKWLVDALAPDESIQFSYDATLTTLFPMGTVNVIQSTSVASADTTATTAETSLTVSIAPELEFSVTHSPTPILDANNNGIADPGDTIQAQFSIRNRGNAAALNVQLIGDYDESMATNAINADRNGQIGAGEVTWMLNEIEPGGTETFTFDIILNPRFPAGDTTVRTAGTLRHRDEEPITAEQTLVVTAQPILEVSIGKVPGLINDLNSNGEIDPGDTVGYQITYANRGNASASNVEIATSYDSSLVRTVDHVIGDGIEEGNGIRWRLAEIEPESEGLLSYQATLAKVFPAGESNVANNVTISHEDVSVQSSEHSLRITAAPILKIDTESVADLIQDLNSNGKADPGDTLRYKVTYQNQGTAPASDVIIVADYAEGLVSNLANITPSTAVDDGDALKWSLSEPVAPGTETTFTYDVRLKNEMPEATTTIQHLVSLFSQEQEPVSNSTLLTIEPPSVVEDSFGRGLFAGNTNTLSILVGLLVAAALFVLTYVGAIATPKVQADDSEEAKEAYALERARVSMVREGVFLTFIIASVLILALGEGIKEDGAISILSAIVGYVFGRVSSSG